MELIDHPISIGKIKEIAEHGFGNLVKAVVDIKKNIMVIDADLHSDEESLLIQSGSKQADLWGINLYPQNFDSSDFVEFDSMINLRPSQNNFSRGIKSLEIKKIIIKIIKKLVIA